VKKALCIHSTLNQGEGLQCLVHTLPSLLEGLINFQHDPLLLFKDGQFSFDTLVFSFVFACSFTSHTLQVLNETLRIAVVGQRNAVLLGDESCIQFGQHDWWFLQQLLEEGAFNLTIEHREFSSLQEDLLNNLRGSSTLEHGLLL